MKYQIFKMRFKNYLHAGEKNLTDSSLSISADTLFSALCFETLKHKGPDGIKELVSLAKSGDLQISDALPYLEQGFFIPKPITHIEPKEISNDSTIKKAFKKLKFIDVTMLKDYFSGDLDPKAEGDIFSEIGWSDLRSNVNIRSKETGGDPEPYHVGTYKFAENAGLYVLVGSKNGFELIKNLFKSLSYSGIGGKRSSGFGTFEIEQTSAQDFEPFLKNAEKSKKKMSISVSMAKENELEKALQKAEYSLKRRAGFVASPNYADSFLRKKDFYSFAAGSCFENIFEGDVFDVSNGGNHPVYRYAKPLFLGVN